MDRATIMIIYLQLKIYSVFDKHREEQNGFSLWQYRKGGINYAEICRLVIFIKIPHLTSID